MFVAWPARAREASISSWVRFLDRRKERRCSMGADATDGSWRTVENGVSAALGLVRIMSTYM